MTAFKLEGKLRVIDRPVPAFCGMARGTVGAELARVLVILGVAGVAILLQLFFIQRPFVARRAGRLDVLASKDVLGISIVVKG